MDPAIAYPLPLNETIRKYFVRITPSVGYGLQQLKEVLDTLSIERYFICEETATRLHYHACIYTKRSAESLRYQLKRYIQGEVYISGRDIEDQVKAVAYCMKDGKWLQKNMDVNTLLMAQTVTRKKEAKFDKALNDIIDDINLGTRQMVRAIVQLHVKHNRRIYPQHIEAMVRLGEAKRSRDYTERLVDRIVREIEFS